MSAARSYLDNMSARAHKDSEQLLKVQRDLDIMRADRDRLAENIAAAEKYEAVLVKAVAASQRILDEEWEDGWPVTPPPPSKIEHEALAASTTTQAIPAPTIPDGASDDLTAMYCAEHCQRLLVVDPNGRGWVHEDDETRTCRADLRVHVPVGAAALEGGGQS